MARNIFVVVLVVALTSAVFADYNTRFEHIDVDAIINNKRILTSFIKCFMDEGPCTGDAKDLKDIMPEVVETRCQNCTVTQKKLMGKAVKFLIDERADDWKRLVDKYDPKHQHEDDLKQFLDEISKL